MIGELDMLIRLGAATAAGAAVGLEREARARPAGVRTHALVALGAALFTVGGAYGFADVARSANVDPARVAAQVASGIGFIGAGAIIRHGANVRGVTTAATLWLAAALGLAAGAGLLAVAAGATGIVLVTLVGLGGVKRLIGRVASGSGLIEVQYERGHGTLGPLIRGVELAQGRVSSISVTDDDDDARAPGVRQVAVEVVLPHRRDADRISEVLLSRPEVHQVRFEFRGRPRSA